MAISKTRSPLHFRKSGLGGGDKGDKGQAELTVRRQRPRWLRRPNRAAGPERREARKRNAPGTPEPRAGLLGLLGRARVPRTPARPRTHRPRLPAAPRATRSTPGPPTRAVSRPAACREAASAAPPAAA
ncbi:hypothetical protein P7K49_015365 [Saguinus oedipus]|uniref:Uncharacterized protein n=1 Tax=Saguinus oedipus TaxID=9490 RepID=A0ABQ9V922_SAGOE|nr:hypothetical protein P7K49_015365 [Saguinus oedipus]